MYEATAKRLSEELGGLGYSPETTEYHKAKQIDARLGAPVRNGDVLVPGYDSQGKLWTVQYIKADGTKRFAKDSRKHACFHVVEAPNSAAALQKIAVSPVGCNRGMIRDSSDDCQTAEHMRASRV
jgi:putative DNA primase/helicase